MNKQNSYLSNILTHKPSNAFIQQTYLFRLKIHKFKGRIRKCLFQRFQPLLVFFKGSWIKKKKKKKKKKKYLNFLLYIDLKSAMFIMNVVNKGC